MKEINTRIASIDAMRGMVILIMAIDHIRDLLHTTALTNDPLDLATTSPALFLTRWITHLCAPVFVFLAGTSAYLTCISQNNLSKTKSFIRSRGIWLMILEVTIIGFGVWFDVYFRTILFQVIFVIGAGFFILSFLLRIPARILGMIGIGIIVLHNLSVFVKIDKTTPLGFIWTLLLDSGFFKLGEDRGLLIGYAVLPWLGIMLLGFGFGQVFTYKAEKQKRILLASAGIALTLFVLLRFFNLYGDRNDWSQQASWIHSVFSFIKVTKYPPSLLYACMTLGIMFVILWFMNSKSGSVIDFLVVYGKVPLFFYILHWYIIHLSMFVMLWLQGAKWEDVHFGLMEFGRPATGFGLSLPYMYVYWLSLVVFMFPLCRWFGKYKAKNKHITWLKYM